MPVRVSRPTGTRDGERSRSSLDASEEIIDLYINGPVVGDPDLSAAEYHRDVQGRFAVGEGSVAQVDLGACEYGDDLAAPLALDH